MLGDRGDYGLRIFKPIRRRNVRQYIRHVSSHDLDKMKIDPALATGPFITITNDIIGMMIYMFITSALA